MTSTTALATRLQRLEDREAIKALIARYGLAMDDRDMQGMSDLFTEDVRITWKPFRPGQRHACAPTRRPRGQIFLRSSPPGALTTATRPGAAEWPSRCEEPP